MKKYFLLLLIVLNFDFCYMNEFGNVNFNTSCINNQKEINEAGIKK